MDNSSQPTVLIVEDEVFTRMIATEVFTDAGFEVLGASSSDEAIDILSDRPDIAALFTDVDMPPGVSGYRLAQKARLTHPNLAVMITSGRPDPEFAYLPAGGRFTKKPYDVTKMIVSVREMITAAQS